jgi:electron transfer flavoprotein alpha subunit
LKREILTFLRYGDAVSQVVKTAIQTGGYDKVVAATSAFGKDVIPRVGGLIDSQPITDVIQVLDNGAKFVRPIYAGNAVATVSSSDKVKLFTVRATNFEKVPAGSSNSYPIEEVKAEDAKTGGQWIENQVSVSEMAELSSAKYVVSGGRGMKNGENFKILYDLASVLGG